MGSSAALACHPVQDLGSMGLCCPQSGWASSPPLTLCEYHITQCLVVLSLFPYSTKLTIEINHHAPRCIVLLPYWSPAWLEYVSRSQGLN